MKRNGDVLIITVTLIPLLNHILSNPVFAQEREKVVWVLVASMFLITSGCGEPEEPIGEDDVKPKPVTNFLFMNHQMVVSLSTYLLHAVVKLCIPR